MKLYLKTKNVLDEREMQEVYCIEHRGLWGMYTLLCAAVILQMLFGAGFAQVTMLDDLAFPTALRVYREIAEEILAE